jgi:hypothetical protein
MDRRRDPRPAGGPVPAGLQDRAPGRGARSGAASGARRCPGGFWGTAPGARRPNRGVPGRLRKQGGFWGGAASGARRRGHGARTAAVPGRGPGLGEPDLGLVSVWLRPGPRLRSWPRLSMALVSPRSRLSLVPLSGAGLASVSARPGPRLWSWLRPVWLVHPWGALRGPPPAEVRLMHCPPTLSSPPSPVVSVPRLLDGVPDRRCAPRRCISCIVDRDRRRPGPRPGRCAP